jgi:ADP-heptose:LPS heptosyltransferase
MTGDDGTFARVRRLLIFRTGSIGDTVTALPVFHLLRRSFPHAERRVLTNFPINSDAAPLQSVLGEAGFIHGYFPFPARLRDPRHMMVLCDRIRGWRPDLTVYLRERRNVGALLRDVAFLRLAGASRMVGAPLARALRRNAGPGANGLWEGEAARLARCLARIGDARADDPASWSLDTSASEEAEARALLAGWAGRTRFATFAVGAKIDFKDWGDDNWRRVLAGLAESAPGLGLVLVGATNDSGRARSVAAVWRGPVLDLCGRCAPRLSALVIRRAVALLCHDSGPMHLAASVGTPAVAVFSTHARPGVWFPFGARHRVFYPGLAWSGGDPPVLRDATGEYNITQVPPEAVLAAARRLVADASGG